MSKGIGSTQQSILDFLAKREPATTAELAEATGRSQAQIRAACDALEGRELVAIRRQDGIRRVWLAASIEKPPARYEIRGTRHRQIANANHERLGTVMGALDAYRGGLPAIKLDAALAVSRPDEIKAWGQTIDGVREVLHDLRAKLRAYE